MFERRRVLSRMVVLAIAFIVGCSMVIGSTTVEASAATKTPGKVTISQLYSYDYNAAKISWKKAVNAKSYQVYRSTSLNGSYKLIKTTTACSYVNKGLITGKKYYYKVRAVNGSKKGTFSSKKSVVPKLKTPVLSITGKGETYVSVKYSKVNGATGYQVYRSTNKNGSYSKVGSFIGLTVKNTRLQANTGYYYKVRAYRKVNGKLVYGSFSTVKSVKTLNHNWQAVVNTDGTVSQDKCSVCGEVRTHNHTWVEQKEWVDPGTGHYEQDNKDYFICGICADKHIWTDLSGDAEFRYNHQLEHALAGELGSGNHDAQKDSTYRNLTEEDLQIWVPDPKVEQVVGYKCSICGFAKEKN